MAKLLKHFASDGQNKSGADDKILWPKEEKDKSRQALLTSQNFLPSIRRSEVRDPSEQQLLGWLSNPEITCDRNQKNPDQN